MTIRDQISGRKSRAQIITIVGFVLFGVGGWAASSHNMLWPMAVVGFAIFFGGTLYQAYGIRCPGCRDRIGLPITTSGSLFGIPKNFRFCPFCGISLDTQLDELPKV